MTLRSEKGMLFLNSLFDLAVLLVLLPLIVLFFSFALSFSEDLDAKQLEWLLFTEDLRSYLTQVDSVEAITSGSGIRIIQQGTEYDIESYANVLRKQKFREGHEIMLTGVKTCQFLLDGDRLTVQLEFSTGQREEAEYRVTHP
ncbi:competence type IV pilus minor pilin ComGF [Planococcus sp. YIM B11945]|uniref:competence type IV pilus minor pilin ComGF n=1 Tax=Planococcus sp. YIM B11945 TaxID=3435410 RepID=UPI003D7E2BDF